jgi:hypothetical protein
VRKKRRQGGHGLNPDSAVPGDAMSEEQTFRSEVNGSLPLSGHRSSVLQDEIENLQWCGAK